MFVLFTLFHVDRRVSAISPTPISPTPILPTYYRLVPFRLLMQNVTKTMWNCWNKLYKFTKYEHNHPPNEAEIVASKEDEAASPGEDWSKRAKKSVDMDKKIGELK